MSLTPEGLVFEDRLGKVTGELTPARLRLEGGSDKLVTLEAGTQASLSFFSQDRLRTTLWTDGDETQLSFHEGEGVRRAGLTVEGERAGLTLSERDDASHISLLCGDGRAHIVKQP